MLIYEAKFAHYIGASFFDYASVFAQRLRSNLSIFRLRKTLDDLLEMNSCSM